MKKILFAALLVGGAALTGLTASAKDGKWTGLDQDRGDLSRSEFTRHDNKQSPQSISAQGMSTAGLLAASAMAAGIYAIRRRRKSRA